MAKVFVDSQLTYDGLSITMSETSAATLSELLAEAVHALRADGRKNRQVANELEDTAKRIDGILVRYQ